MLRVPPAPAPSAHNACSTAAKYGGVLPHAKVIVRAPHGDLGADAMIIGPRKTPAAPLEIREHAVPPLGAQRVEALFEEGFVIHHSRGAAAH